MLLFELGGEEVVVPIIDSEVEEELGPVEVIPVVPVVPVVTGAGTSFQNNF